MSHMIAEINGKAAVAYQGETPWHRLGTPMIGFPDVAAAMTAATLDWDVSLEPMYVKNVNAKGYTKVPARRAVVRDVDEAVLATVGMDYEPLQNAEAFGVLNTACREFGVTIETAGALGRGDRVWALAKMPDTIEPVPGDKVEGYLLITAGHNGWTPYTGRLTPVRVVCHNTLTLALSRGDSIFKLRHVKSELEQLELVNAMVTNLVGTLKVMGESFSKLAHKKMSGADVDSYIDAVLGIPSGAEIAGVLARKRETIKELVTTGKGNDMAPKTLWAAYNAVTQFVDHNRTATDQRVLRQADESALFGQSAKLKVKALNLALAAA